MTVIIEKIEEWKSIEDSINDAVKETIAIRKKTTS